MNDAPLDIEQPDQLLAYLRATNLIERDETPQMKTLAGGVSNRTVLVKRASGEAWVLKQALAKLRVKVDWFSDPARIHREALGLRWLEKLAPPDTITPLVFEDPQHHLLAMQAVPEPHENWKTMLLRGEVDTDHVKQFARILAAIHSRSADAAESLPKIFDDRTFFESLRIEPYYRFSASQVPEAASFIDALVEDTRGTRLSIVHGDYSPKNILVRDGRLVLLDHEVIHWGDPAFDVGFALTHLLSKGHHLFERQRDFQTAAIDFWIHYEIACGQRWNKTFHDRAFRHTLACLLARAVGRSQLEYLNDAQRERQKSVVVRMINDGCWTDHIGAVIAEFLNSVAHAED
jgi:aminoglycoside phosphotransferase (APT) family kinase protein